MQGGGGFAVLYVTTPPSGRGGDLRGFALPVNPVGLSGGDEALDSLGNMLGDGRPLRYTGSAGMVYCPPNTVMLWGGDERA